jgi:hypothetical protein
MNVQLITMLITTGVVGGVLGSTVAFSLLKKKGINVDKGIETINNVVQAAEPVINVASELLPNNPSIGVLKIVEKWAKIAAGNAEQLSHAGDISKDDRAQVAEDVVNAVLKELDVEVTDNRKVLIDAAIKDVVNGFGHTEPSEQQRAEEKAVLENEKQELLVQLAAVQKENDTLKQTITNAASLVQASTVQPAGQ